MFSEKYPIAWSYHRNTSRWPFNMHEIPSDPGVEAPFKEYLHAPVFPLPEPRRTTSSLQESIKTRISCRRFKPAPLELGDLSALLKATYGVQGAVFLGDTELLERPVPSGGGLYPLELYGIIRNIAGLDPGIYHYNALCQLLEQVRVLELPGLFVADLFMGQSYIVDAAVILVFTGIVERSFWKYGDRGYRYLFLEAGHAAQNLNLSACALGLASLNLGGFFDHDMAKLLSLNLEEEIPLYGVAVGVPETEQRDQIRLPRE